MHDDREATSEGDTDLLQAAALRNCHGPRLQCERLFAAGQDRVDGFVEQLADGPIPLLGDPARPIELARLMTSRYETKIGAGIA